MTKKTTKVDLHCHSTASAVSKLGVSRSLGLPECATPPDEVYALAKRRGMDFVTVTDHDTIDGALELAGRYADHLDLAPPSHCKASNEFQRKLLTTTDDLADAAAAAREAGSGAGRALTFSVLLTHVVFCAESEAAAEEERICAALELAPRPLGDCPFVLVGEPQRMADALRERRERIGLTWIVLPRDVVDRFCADVAPLLT